MTYSYCLRCAKKFRSVRASNNPSQISIDYCAVCIRRLVEAGHIMRKGPTGPGGQKGKKKTRAKRAMNSIPRAPQGDE
jgi:predicted nucleic acid-binding Zn ribbon protein